MNQMPHADSSEGDSLQFNEKHGTELFGIPYTEMLYVAPGEYTMTDGGDTTKTHSITFTKGFYIGKYPVTQELYEHVMGRNPARYKGKRRPVENVSWDDICLAEGFLEKLNEKVQATYGTIGTFNLPSEAQWEYAAAGGSKWTTEAFRYAGSNRLEDVGWFDKNSQNQTQGVGLKQPNALGLHDMSGNVWEWCRDKYTDDIKKLPSNGSPYEEKGDSRSLRGGSFFFRRGFCRLRGPASTPGPTTATTTTVFGWFFPSPFPVNELDGASRRMRESEIKRVEMYHKPSAKPKFLSLCPTNFLRFLFWPRRPAPKR